MFVIQMYNKKEYAWMCVCGLHSYIKSKTTRPVLKKIQRLFIKISEKFRE